MGKEWRTLEWLPDYAISEDGDIERVVDGVTRKAGFRPRGSIRGGYHAFKLSINGKKRTWLAHRLVCEAWHGPAPSAEHQVAHGDGNPLNNHFSNLRWATCLENQRDRRKHGTAPIGENNPRAKITAAQAREIKRRYCGRYGQVAQLSREFGLSHSATLSICKGEHWNG